MRLARTSNCIKRSLIILVTLIVSITSYAGPVSRLQDTSEGFIEVTGNVQHPGRYHWSKGMTAFDAIQAAGGLKEATENQAKTLVSIIEADGKRKIWKYENQAVANAKKVPLIGASAKINVERKVF